MVAILLSTIALGLSPLRGELVRSGDGGAHEWLQDALECLRFQSPDRLLAGTPFRAALPRGLEFRLSAGWEISVGPADEPNVDYLWIVSPPLRTAPHRMIGPGYGVTARESARLERLLRFVLTRADYDLARAAVERDTTGGALAELERLGKGQVSLTITDFRVRDVVRPEGTRSDAFAWIVFRGEACVPRVGVQ